MTCSECGFENPAGMRFCGECGARLPTRCPVCGFDNPPRAKFCGGCGTAVAARTPSEASEAAGDPKSRESLTPQTQLATAVAERRQLTIMFCDLVGSTRLSGRLDAEDLREVIRAYQAACEKVTRRYEGHIAQYLGDGVLVYFGYPQAHEDDAQRAVRAGLGILEAVTQLNPTLREQWGVELSLRIGLHTGLVVVGDIGGEGRHEQLALGDVPNIAARVQAVADPDTVVITDATHRLVEGLFDCRELGPHTPTGTTHPVGLFEATHESGARNRFDVVSAAGLAPLVGREPEISLLLERWQQAREGMGRVALIGGEAGIGKSHLVWTLQQHVAEDAQAWLTEWRCSPYHQNSALYPIIEMLETVVLEFARHESPEEKLAKIEGFLVQYGFALEESAPVLAALLSVPLGEGYAASEAPPEEQKRKTLEIIVTALLVRARFQPMLLVVEDLQWADASTVELLSMIIDQAPTARLLAVFTYRPQFHPPWAGDPEVDKIALGRLLHDETVLIVDRLTGGKPLPSQVLAQVIAKTDGVPLFVEELVKTVLESGVLREEEGEYRLDGPLLPVTIPSTLQDSLMARIDRLSTVKEVVQVASALGRQFSYELISAVSPMGGIALERELDRLVEAELLYQRGVPPQATYTFKHALIQDAAYESLLRRRREETHAAIARALMERFPEVVETQPELVAHHLTSARRAEEALPYWKSAGNRAVERSANTEAIGHFGKALDLLESLPDGPERAEEELALRVALATPLVTTKGYAAPEVEATYARARELCDQVGDTPQLFRVLWGLWAFYLVRTDLGAAGDLAERCVRLADNARDPALQMEARRNLGATMLWHGELATARRHLEQALALYGREKHGSHAFVFGQDPGVASLSYQAMTLWSLGEVDDALAASQEAVDLARSLAHPYSLVYALLFASVVRQLRREGETALEDADALIAASREYGFGLGLAWGPVMRGWALAETGRQEEGIAEMTAGLDITKATRSELLLPYYLHLLAMTYQKSGQLDEATGAIADAVEVMERTGQRWCEAELCRLQGELLHARDKAGPEPEALFLRAIDVARQQGARSYELRATMSLSRLWCEQGRRSEALATLEAAVAPFAQGFDTPDLRDAKALLETLS
ncbi:AAA family ATPase [Candidatus Poribacteria bacterium]|jgi:class 3 adenylate cyclase/predicted ATPase|nr:AAA family ATPase [Candidatus Poribacteria bacterium]MBT5710327.1 AAA family ATPase [Candidatus Poribacteria bacterium]MBT7101182.1 AAA family ATPase [Candidatus Poribacteria bacterium]MBT7808386.1 AAA family ATPase [Candidatus Poribacteria bacterium]